MTKNEKELVKGSLAAYRVMIAEAAEDVYDPDVLDLCWRILVQHMREKKAKNKKK